MTRPEEAKVCPKHLLEREASASAGGGESEATQITQSDSFNLSS